MEWASLARGGKVGRGVVGSVHLGLRVIESSSRIMAPPDDEECVVEGSESTWESLGISLGIDFRCRLRDWGSVMCGSKS